MTAESSPPAVLVTGVRTIGRSLLAPAVVTVVGTAVWLVLDSSARGLGSVWVQVGIGLVAPAFLVGAVVLAGSLRAWHPAHHDDPNNLSS
jgi:hypothetical protein